MILSYRLASNTRTNLYLLPAVLYPLLKRFYYPCKAVVTTPIGSRNRCGYVLPSTCNQSELVLSSNPTLRTCLADKRNGISVTSTEVGAKQKVNVLALRPKVATPNTSKATRLFYSVIKLESLMSTTQMHGNSCEVRRTACLVRSKLPLTQSMIRLYQWLHSKTKDNKQSCLKTNLLVD